MLATVQGTSRGLNDGHEDDDKKADEGERHERDRVWMSRWAAGRLNKYTETGSFGLHICAGSGRSGETNDTVEAEF